MIRIDKITRGRFGNRILQYNSAYQMAKKIGTEIHCGEWEGFDVFKNLPSSENVYNRDKKIYSWEECLEDSWQGVKELHSTHDLVLDDPAYMLHNVFYKLTEIAPRNFMKIRSELRPNLSKETVHIGIHIRGDDIISRDGNGGREIHGTKYYIDAIEAIEKEEPDRLKVYYVCSDDLTFQTFKETIRHLMESGKTAYCGPATGNPSTINHVMDFSLLSECDYLIASSSTYAVCAGLVGKEKRIIHSNAWLQKNVDHEPWHNYEDEDRVRRQQISFDNFWIEVYNGGNKFYKAWKII